jgi:23S rRNA (uracil1939-C5)-methyltransferase
MARSRKSASKTASTQARIPVGPITIESVDLEGQGVAHREDGKVVFIDGALPGERVSYFPGRSKNNWEKGELTELHSVASLRVKPRCENFGLHQGACGGCKVMHLEPTAQVAVKARAMEDNLWHLGKVKPDTVLSPMHGPSWGYRYRARLSVRYVIKRDEVLIGFHERSSRYIADMKTCQILPPHVSALLMPLRALIGSLAARETCPQIEVACGESPSGAPITALVLRHLEALVDGDVAKLRAFAAEQTAAGVQWWLQSKGPDTVKLLDDRGADHQLGYRVGEFDLFMPYKPTDFTQVNPMINDALVSRAVRWLDVQPQERVIDWFCGLGNFTLPLATQAREVLGIEGSATLVARAKANFDRYADFYTKKWHVPSVNRASLAINTGACSFAERNLFEITPAVLVADGTADKWLIDPPREGAFALSKALADLHQARSPAKVAVEGEEPESEAVTAARAVLNSEAGKAWQAPKRIVYVSCNPATLARDAGLLVNLGGYTCVAAGVINMFPHTAHVESMAVFELN